MLTTPRSEPKHKEGQRREDLDEAGLLELREGEVRAGSLDPELLEERLFPRQDDPAVIGVERQNGEEGLRHAVLA